MFLKLIIINFIYNITFIETVDNKYSCNAKTTKMSEDDSLIGAILKNKH
ncbi:unnamed protein product [Commensalibacter communis]|nr:unnamed protein product [Commensalibacter communis]CAI3960037.1 unnamed protein product [Commensalibacter communis]